MKNITLDALVHSLADQVAAKILIHLESYTNSAQNQDKQTPAHSESNRLMEIDEEFVTVSQVLQKIKVSRSTLWRLQRSGKFPKPKKVFQNKVVWLSSDIRNWITQVKSE